MAAVAQADIAECSCFTADTDVDVLATILEGSEDCTAAAFRLVLVRGVLSGSDGATFLVEPIGQVWLGCGWRLEAFSEGGWKRFAGVGVDGGVSMLSDRAFM